jgi:hypothetical protein
MPSRLALKPVTAALLAAAVISAPILAQDSIKEETTVLPGHAITPWEEARISAVAVKVLRHIADARGKLQLACARIDHLFSKDNAAAKVDLAEAKGYLDAAAEKSKADTKAKVEAVAGLVQGLEKGIGSDKGGDAVAFHQAEAQLSALIGQL